MTARPKKPATAGASRELVLLLGNQRRDVLQDLLFRNGNQQGIAVGTTAGRVGPQLKFQVLVGCQLTQLVGHMITLQESQSSPQYSALCEVAVAGQQPPPFFQEASDELVIINRAFVRRIVAEYPQPPRQLVQHRVGEEPLW